MISLTHGFSTWTQILRRRAQDGKVSQGVCFFMNLPPFSSQCLTRDTQIFTFFLSANLTSHLDAGHEKGDDYFFHPIFILTGSRLHHKLVYTWSKQGAIHYARNRGL
jgi:hypothetical protein